MSRRKVFEPTIATGPQFKRSSGHSHRCSLHVGGRFLRFSFMLVLISIFTEFSFISGNTDGGRRMHQGKMDGDIIIGALFPVHKAASSNTSSRNRRCGDIWEQYGIHRIEVFLRTIDRINSGSDAGKILPRNVTLGSDIRDSCWHTQVALEQSIDFIKTSIASLEQQASNKSGRGSSLECERAGDKPIAGLIGPGSSSVTIQVQNMLSLFQIPQIGYSATSSDLTDKTVYTSFLRVVPSDRLQARVMVDLVKHFKWNYISTVYTDGNYGLRGMSDFKDLARKSGLCEAASESITKLATDEAHEQVINNINDKKASVVVCFCEGETMRDLIKATARLGFTGKFLFIGSDGWGIRKDVVETQEAQAAGGISIKLYSPEIADFDDYFFSLNPFTNRRNPWFKEFWQERFECYIDGPDRIKQYTRPCTGKEDLRERYSQDSKLGFVVNAVYTMAHALSNMHRDLCPGRPTLCEAMQPINGTILFDYLRRVAFTSYSGDRIGFDKNGDPIWRYDVMNYQKVSGNGSTAQYDYVMMAKWYEENLSFEDVPIYWPNPQGVDTSGPAVTSVCSPPCAKGHVKKYHSGSTCCWECKLCLEQEIVLNETVCTACEEGYWPDDQITTCVKIEIEYLQWSDTEAILSMTVAGVGIVCTSGVMSVFMRHNNTPVVKASTRELSYLILLGVCLSYITTFPLIARPSQWSCYLTRILPGLSFSFIYAALVTKTNRIARILAGSKRIMTQKPRFMSASAQVLITCLLITVECVIIAAMLAIEPKGTRMIYPKRRAKLECNLATLDIVVPLGYDLFLVVMCTLYAVKTRNLPENFNEAKFIGFTMYTTCVIWIAFVPIYFGSDNKVITMCLAVSLSATVALVLLFLPKTYIIVFKPEKNNRSAFTTSKDLRCHIGSSSSASVSTTLNARQCLSATEISVCDNSKGPRQAQSKSPRSVIHPCDYQRQTVSRLDSHQESFSLTPEGDDELFQPPVTAGSAAGNRYYNQISVGWNDKAIEEPGVNLFRESFFSKWRFKGRRSTTRTAEQFASATKGDTVRGERKQGAIQSTEQAICAVQVNAATPSANNNSEDAIRNSTTNWSRIEGHGNSALNATNGSQKPSNNNGSRNQMIESYVQTDDEIFQEWVFGLRKRFVGGDQSKKKKVPTATLR